MNIYDTSSKENSLYHFTTGLLGLPVTDTTTLTREDFVRSANVWLRNINEWIWKSQNTWQYDDTTNTGMPEAYTDMVDEQQKYELPTTVFDVRGAEILDSNGDKVLLHPVTEDTDANMSAYETAGLPRYYSLTSNIIKLYPPPSEDDVTLSEGLILYVARDIVGVNSTATTTEPGIPRQFHDAIAFGVAKDKSISFGMPDLFQKMNTIIQEKRAEIEGHFSRRHRDVKRRLRPSVGQSI